MHAQQYSSQTASGGGEIKINSYLRHSLHSWMWRWCVCVCALLHRITIGNSFIHICRPMDCGAQIQSIRDIFRFDLTHDDALVIDLCIVIIRSMRCYRIQSHNKSWAITTLLINILLSRFCVLSPPLLRLLTIHTNFDDTCVWPSMQYWQVSHCESEPTNTRNGKCWNWSAVARNAEMVDFRYLRRIKDLICNTVIRSYRHRIGWPDEFYFFKRVHNNRSGLRVCVSDMTKLIAIFRATVLMQLKLETPKTTMLWPAMM